MKEKQIDIIIDLLTDFDEMGFAPTTAVPDPDAYAIEWKNKLTNALQGYHEQEWISVEDRLPDRSGKYLVATFDRRVGIGNLIDCYCDGDLSFDNYKVTHWMPLPDAPNLNYKRLTDLFSKLKKKYSEKGGEQE